MPLQATSGAASYDAFGGGAAAVPAYIEEVFSTWLYNGNSPTGQSIDNGIDLAGKGGLVWLKSRSDTTSNNLFDTVRGVNNRIFSNLDIAQQNLASSLTSFNSNGFTLGTTASGINTGGQTFVSWTFREQPKFFDVQTFTYPMSGSITVPHNLESTPGCVMVKVTDGADNWLVYHRMANNGTNPSNYILQLNTTSAQINNFASWITVGSTSITFPSGALNPGSNFVMYLFAHDAGGFGLTGTDNVISCGSYTGDTSSFTPITLGYEPQWLMIKRSDGVGNWVILDTTRGMPTFDSTGAAYGQILRPNLSLQETTGNATPYPVSTGFGQHYADGDFTTGNFIYIAIRRGPMKVPTLGTTVYNADAEANATAPWFVSGFPVDFAFKKVKTAATDWQAVSRLTGTGYLTPNSTALENSSSEITFDFMNGWNSTASANAALWSAMFKRAPSFMDVVCYTGTGAVRTVNHNLGAVPELMIVKDRSTAGTAWNVYVSALGNTKALFLETNTTGDTDSLYWNNTSPTSSLFTAGTLNSFSSSRNYIAYLFATCAGVSKVGSYTGNGTTQTIDCGFTGGARFVLIKRTDATGDWYVYDTARGMTVLTNPYLRPNSTGAEVATLGSVTTVSTGFALDATILAAINAGGGSYIFLAIA
jgi:hypothetical protein